MRVGRIQSAAQIGTMLNVLLDDHTHTHTDTVAVFLPFLNKFPCTIQFIAYPSTSEADRKVFGLFF